MRVIGRLALAAALLVPVGIATANSAGASSGTVHCTTTHARIVDSPGLLLSTAASQTLSVPATAPGALGGCSGFGIAGTTTGALTFSVQTPSHVTCQSIIGKQDNGNGKIVWATSSHNGSTTLKAGIKITGPTTATLTGTVTTSAGNYLKGEHVLAHLTFSPNIAPQGVGAGTCSNVHKIKSLTANATDFTIAP